MDPLFSKGVDLAVVLIVLLKVFVVFVGLLLSVLLMIWFERKIVSDMQSRIGPNRAGPYGILQTLADGVKLFFKEDILPTRADRRVFRWSSAALRHGYRVVRQRTGQMEGSASGGQVPL